MNHRQIQCLKSLGIPIWVSDAHISKWEVLWQPAKFKYLCFISLSEWAQPDLKSLFSKVIEALKWPKEACMIVGVKAPMSLAEFYAIEGDNGADVIVSFGDSVVGREDARWVQVPSCNLMHQNQKAKREAWLLLKQYVE